MVILEGPGWVAHRHDPQKQQCLLPEEAHPTLLLQAQAWRCSSTGMTRLSRHTVTARTFEQHTCNQVQAALSCRRRGCTQQEPVQVSNVQRNRMLKIDCLHCVVHLQAQLGTDKPGEA